MCELVLRGCNRCCLRTTGCCRGTACCVGATGCCVRTTGCCRGTACCVGATGCCRGTTGCCRGTACCRGATFCDPAARSNKIEMKCVLRGRVSTEQIIVVSTGQTQRRPWVPEMLIRGRLECTNVLTHHRKRGSLKQPRHLQRARSSHREVSCRHPDTLKSRPSKFARREVCQ